ncbi:DnaJ protein [Forsythia ovata]|uniref:DnaJ protein n=1 Tax=Forsythia ovata TaxID=205694 RepID=A0ABD1RJ41_9LAMI
MSCGSVSSSWIQFNDSKKNVKNEFMISCVYSSSAVSDPCKTLKIRPDAFEFEINKAYRKLALPLVLPKKQKKAGSSRGRKPITKPIRQKSMKGEDGTLYVPPKKVNHMKYPKVEVLP